jgi:hypothetical protein
MKLKKFEQISDPPGHRSGWRVFIKKSTNRALRRAAKIDPENAPVKVRFRGYTT